VPVLLLRVLLMLLSTMILLPLLLLGLLPRLLRRIPLLLLLLLLISLPRVLPVPSLPLTLLLLLPILLLPLTLVLRVPTAKHAQELLDDPYPIRHCRRACVSESKVESGRPLASMGWACWLFKRKATTPHRRTERLCILSARKQFLDSRFRLSLAHRDITIHGQARTMGMASWRSWACAVHVSPAQLPFRARQSYIILALRLSYILPVPSNSPP
jgi:hypothetical protein